MIGISFSFSFEYIFIELFIYAFTVLVILILKRFCQASISKSFYFELYLFYVTIISKCFLIVLVVVNSNNTDSKLDVILNYYVK